MATNPLEEMLCFSLYAASRAVSQAYRAVLAERDLTYPQFLVLVALEQAGELSVHELGDLMYLDSGTLSPLLQRLERRGIVRRERRAGNERVVIVTLTDDGRALRAEVGSSVDCVIPAAYGIADRAELEGLLNQLHRVTTGMNAVTATLRTATREATPA